MNDATRLAYDHPLLDGHDQQVARIGKESIQPLRDDGRVEHLVRHPRERCGVART